MASLELRARELMVARIRQAVVPSVWITLALGAVVAYLAYADGSYSLASRSTIAIGVWWSILVGVGFGVWPLAQVTRGAIIPGALLAGFAAWALVSVIWATSAERALAEFDRTALYLGVFVLAVAGAARHRLRHWVDGLALAVSAVAVIALVSRLFPGSFPDRGLTRLFGPAQARLSFPLDYWNGLALFVAIGFPLLLRAAVDSGRPTRLGALALLPALAAVVYLTGSRGGAAVLVIGVVVFLLAARRAEAVGAAVAAGMGSVAAVAVLLPRHALVDGPVHGAAARAQGWQAAVLIGLVCVATAALHVAAALAAARLPRRPRVPRAAGVVAAGLAVVIFAAAVAAAHPVRRLESFKRVPLTPSTSSTVTGQHLASGNGSGRWQFWHAALSEFRHAPLHGGGAGSYEAWWGGHASFPYYVRDAHSLYFQTLGELGIIGFVLVVGALCAGLAVGIRRLRRARGGERTTIAALVGAFVAFVIGVGIDWIWQLTTVTILGVLCLGLLAGPGTVTLWPRPPGDAAVEARGARRRIALVASVVAAGWLLVCAEAIPLLGDVELRKSQDAVAAGRAELAVSYAVAASKIEPWATSPHLQLALVHEGAGDLIAAGAEIDAALARDDSDWRIWLAAARIETKQGDIAAARRSLARARALDPLSPLGRSGR